MKSQQRRAFSALDPELVSQVAYQCHHKCLISCIVAPFCTRYLPGKLLNSPFVRTHYGYSYVQVSVAGSETTAERRAQLYTPNYLHTCLSRPVITKAPSDVGYATNFTISFSYMTSIDCVVLTRLSGSTHGIHFDQRQVVLECSGQGSTSTCTLPPNSNVAPPEVYMLFVLCQGAPSVATYVTLHLPAATDGATGIATAG